MDTAHTSKTYVEHVGAAWCQVNIDKDNRSITHQASWRFLIRYLLPLAFLHGLLYLALVPPWQHYDEPTHFEYARLVALLERRPESGEVDRETNRKIADSMYRFGFWSPGVRPDLLGPQGPNIGITQFVHPSLYYTLVSVPVDWLRYLSVETQLYAARLVSLGLYLCIIVVAWRVCTLLLPDDYLSQVSVPLLIILTPAFSDMMSATNNDVLVNFSITTLLLGCVLLVRDGIQPVPLLLALLSLSVALLSKRTAVVGIVPFTLALFWSLRRRPMHWWLYSLILVGGVLGAIVISVRLAAFGEGSSIQQPFVLRSWLIDLDRHYLRLSLEQIFGSLFDWERTRGLYPSVGRVLFASFWMRFGWGHVKIGILWEYGMLGLVMLGGIGLLLQGIHWRRRFSIWQQRCIWIFIVTLLAAWFAALIRVHPLPPEATGFYVPVGRYIHLAILPTIWLLLWGIQGVVRQRWRAYSVCMLVLFFIAIDTTAWSYTLVNFYYR